MSPEEAVHYEVEVGHRNHPFVAVVVLHTGDAFVVACSVVGIPDQADVADAQGSLGLAVDNSAFLHAMDMTAGHCPAGRLECHLVRKVACFLSSQVGCSGMEGWQAWAGQACGVQAVGLRVLEQASV